jgi:hypothetical protein
MYCNPVAQSYHPENAIFKIFDTAPEPYAVVSLNLNAYGMLNDPNTPFPPDIRALAQNFILKIGGEVVGRHLSRSRNE